MANKNDNYYMLNGDEIESFSIYVPYKDSYVKNVKDISDMDIATINLGTNFKSALEDANPKYKLGNQFYIGKYPYAKGIKIFKPIQIFKETKNSKLIIDEFREIAEERNYNYYHDKILESDKKENVIKLVYTILNDLNNNQQFEVFSKKSILGKEIKKNHYNNKHNFNEQITNYTQLRNLLINYLCIKNGRSLPTNFKLARIANSLENIEGLYGEDPEDIKNALIEYKEALLIAKNEEEIKLAKERLIEKTKEQWTQMTLFDLFPNVEGLKLQK